MEVEPSQTPEFKTPDSAVTVVCTKSDPVESPKAKVDSIDLMSDTEMKESSPAVTCQKPVLEPIVEKPTADQPKVEKNVLETLENQTPVQTSEVPTSAPSEIPDISKLSD